MATLLFRFATDKTAIITVEYGCVAHALKFRWNDEGTYVFAPGRGLVAVDSADE